MALSEDWPELLVIHDGALLAAFFEVVRLQLLLLKAEEEGVALRVLGVGDVFVLGPRAGRESSEDVVGGGECQQDCVVFARACLVEGAGFELMLGCSKH